MRSLEQLLIVACLVLAIGKEAFGQLKPSNVVAEIGGEAIFNCSGTLFLPNWILSKDGTSTNHLPIAGSCNVNANLDDHYRTERTGGPTTCNLIVFNVTMAQAGVYLCVESAAISNALLTVLDSLPTITYNNTPDVIEGENVVITCSLNYSGSVDPAPTLRPYFYWTDYTGNNVSSFNDPPPDNNSVVSQLSVTAGRQDIMPYTCQVYLKLTPTVTSGYASNTPTVTNSASSPTITVLYPPGNISIVSSVLPKDECVQKQESLTCTADANPPAQYEWLDLNSNTISQGSIKYITSGGQYQCTAFNDIRTKRYNQTKTATEANCYPVKEDNMTISGPGCTKDSCYCTGNQQLELTCQVYSVPKPTYRWWYNDQEYSNTQTIPVTYDGNYSCTANSSLGTNSSKATVSTRVYNCTATPTIMSTTTRSTTTWQTSAASMVSASTTTSTTTSSTSSDSCDVAIAAAIAVGVILFISLVMNVILLVFLIRNVREKQVPNLFRRTENIPEILDPSDPSTPSTYEELRRHDEIRFQPTTYQELTLRPPLYVNQVI